MTKIYIYRCVCRIAESSYCFHHICPSVRASVCPSERSSTPLTWKKSLKSLKSLKV